MNFNLGLQSFEPHIAGALNLIKLSSEAKNLLPIFFTSSIGTLGNWAQKHPGTAVPEVALNDPTISTAQGYSESKWVTERLLDVAREHAGVSSAILRVGQIAGPVNVPEGKYGMWNKQEWLPTVRTHVALFMIFNALVSNLSSRLSKALSILRCSPAHLAAKTPSHGCQLISLP